MPSKLKTPGVLPPGISGIHWTPHRSLTSQTDCQTKFSSSKSTGLDANNCGQTYRHTHKQTNSLYHRSEITANVNNTWQCLILTLWRPLLPYRYSYKASCARLVKPSFVIFDIRTLWRWYMMLYSCTTMATLGVKGLRTIANDTRSRKKPVFHADNHLPMRLWILARASRSCGKSSGESGYMLAQWAASATQCGIAV